MRSSRDKNKSSEKSHTTKGKSKSRSKTSSQSSNLRKRPPELEESSSNNPDLRKTPPELLPTSKKRAPPLFTSKTLVEDILIPSKKMKIVANVQKIGKPISDKPQPAVLSKKNDSVELSERRVSTRDKRQTEFLGRTTNNESTSTKIVVPVAGLNVSNEHLLDIYQGLTSTETGRIDDAISFIIDEGATLTPANVNRVFLRDGEPAMSANAIRACMQFCLYGKKKS